jgi:beta-aspartyl-peptidase (threonine type)
MSVTVSRRDALLAGAATLAGGAFLSARLAAQETKSRPKFAIALHGGAGSTPNRMTADETKAQEAALGQALDIGVKVLQDGGASLDAVEQVIRFMEDDPLFNAGRGAVFNAADAHELDASIMDGRTLAGGGVAAVRTVRHPITLARLVMGKTRHVLLSSDGAEKFADEMQVERVENTWFSTDKRRRELERAQQADKQSRLGAASSPLTADHSALTPSHGTVGCVALDSAGNLAAGTSTGGRTNKKFGRVGDSPILGAGTYANNASCAASGTGLGEQFIRHAVCYDLSARMLYRRQPLKEAVSEVLHKVLDRGDGGLIALGSDGTIVMDFSTGGMARAAADSTGYREVKIGR